MPGIKKSSEKSRKPSSGEAPTPAKGRRARWLKRVGIVLLALLLLPLLEVGCVRYVDPPATPLMGIRWVEDKFTGKHPPRVAYDWADWRNLPTGFLKAAWVSEDARFFRHHGFDWIEMQRALDESERTGRDPRGSSTITMQCARSLFLWQGHSYVRKGLEAYYTFWMERFLSKRRIFELYANVVELGPGVYGVEAASRHHYRQPARRLCSEQHAFLAAMLPAPRRWNPRTPSPRLLARQRRILRELPLVKWPAP